ncbi:ATP-grasp domain-containing protein [Emticicia sp. SJ17W-69]|uniref:ATP-grasp domain-containing protein n=1 Tax=Emticicia sp. SJ17W-69 TaxID=3421657 RepID=UPI003EBE757C
MKNVLLVSVVDWDSLGEIPAIFKRGGCLQVDVLCNKNTWLLSNRFHDNWIEIKEEINEVLEQIFQLANDETKGYDRVILLDDLIIQLVNKKIESEELFKKILPLTKIENREMLSSKAGFSKVCERNGILSPKFMVYTDKLDADAIDKQMNYPILLKLDLSWSGAGIHFCTDKKSLEEGLEKLSPKENLVIQEFITGEEIGVEALFYEGQLIAYNAAKILDFFENNFSYTTRRTYFRNQEIEALLKTFGKSVGLNGFASIGYIYDAKQNKYFLIESDMRLNNWMSLSRFTGHDFSVGISQIIKATDKQNIDTSLAKPEALNKEIELALFYRDIRRCWKKKDLKGALRWVFNYKGYWRFIPLYDGLIMKRMYKEIKRDLTKNKHKS